VRLRAAFLDYSVDWLASNGADGIYGVAGHPIVRMAAALTVSYSQHRTPKDSDMSSSYQSPTFRLASRLSNIKLRARVDDSRNIQIPESAMRSANLEGGDWVLVWPERGYLVLMPVHSILADYAGSISGLGTIGSAGRQAGGRDRPGECNRSEQTTEGSGA
jgi:hypothetical protein